MKRRDFLQLWGIGGAALLPVATGLRAGAPAPPQSLFILADDMGYGDVHSLNPTSQIPTPNMDRLAAAGMTFTDAHTPSAVCTPTRYGALTGRYCWRTRLKKGVLNGYSTHLVDPGRETVASLLRSHGYYTAGVGKWHLGMDFPTTDGQRPHYDPKTDRTNIDWTGAIAHAPTSNGFDYFYGIPASLDFPPYVYIENDRFAETPQETQPAQAFPGYLRRGPRGGRLVMEEALDHLTQKAVEVIARQAAAEQPFFLYFAMSAPHKPVLPHRRFRGQTGLGPYGDFVAQVDWSVGEILKELERTGIAERTLVVCSSDNGSYMFRLDSPNAPDHVEDPKVQGYRPQHHRPNYVFRGTKADVWEAGHRVPFFVRWPGTVQAGSRCEATVCLTDLFATFAAAIGARVPDGAAEDSCSLLPMLRGEKATRPVPVVNHSGGGMFAIRDGRWKLVLGNGSGGRQKPRGQPFGRPYQLFDLTADPGETKDVAGSHPDRVRELTEKCLAIRKGVH